MLNNKVSRRDVVKHSRTALLAMNVGCSISDRMKGDAEKVALIYGTKYGSTGDTAEWISNGMEKNTDINIENINLQKTLSEYDYFIIGSGVWK